MYSSLDKVDIVVEQDGQKVGVQTDHREQAEILAAWDLSVVFAITRALTPVGYEIVDRVRFTHMHAPPDALVALYSAAGAEVEQVDHPIVPPAPDAAAADAVAAEALSRIGQALLAQWNVTSEEGLSTLQTRIAEQVGALHDDELAGWTRLVELGAAVGELVRRKVPRATWVRDAQRISPIPYLIGHDGYLINVFGKVEKFFRDGPSEAPTHLFRMLADEQSPDGPLMFNLRPSDWGAKEHAQTLAGLLPGEGMEGVDVPLVALVHDLPNSVRTVSRDDAASPEAIEALKAEALANLRKVEVRVHEVPADTQKLVVVEGSYYASEKVLDPEFLRGLHVQLGAEALAVGMPVKGELWAADAISDAIPGFAALLAKRFADAPPNQRLSPQLFVAHDGAVVGIARLTSGEDDGPGHLPEADGAGGDPVAAEPGEPTPRKGFWSRLFGG